MTGSAKAFGRVAVLCGGWAAEREISLRSGQAVFAALARQGVDVTLINVQRATLIAALQAGGFDRAFVILHGRGGEDGVVQGLLETLGLPYTGSGVAGSAIGMDKYRCKLLWQALGVPTPACEVFTQTAPDAATLTVPGPWAVKPLKEGSSLGVSRVTHADDLADAWAHARQYDEEVMVEHWISGQEYTVGILQGRALPVIRLETSHAFYDYAAKYQADDTRYLIPSGLSAAAEARLQARALQAFAAVGARGWGRMDFIADAAGEFWAIEINTAPGMTDHSLVPMAAQAAGLSFDALVWQILAGTLTDGNASAGSGGTEGGSHG